MRLGLFIEISLSTLVVLLGLVFPALADQIFDAQKLIQTQTQNKVNYLEKDCQNIINKNGKNVCFLQQYDEVVALSGSRNGSKYRQKIADEFATLTSVATWDVSVTRVGSELMDSLPCKAGQADFSCSGFVEDRLSGTEVSWADAYLTLVQGKKAASCSKTSHKVAVATFFETKSFIMQDSKRLTLKAFVDGLPTSAAKENFATDLARMAAAFSTRAAIIDLQTFLATDGKIIIFDAEGLDSDTNSRQCWSAAFAGFSKLASQTSK